MLASAGLIEPTPEEESSQDLPTGDNFIDMLGLGTDIPEPTAQPEVQLEKAGADNVSMAEEDAGEKAMEDSNADVTTVDPDEPIRELNEKPPSKSPKKTPGQTPRKSPQKSKVVKASETIITPSRRTPVRGRPRKTPKRPSEILARLQVADVVDTPSSVQVEVRIPPVSLSPVKLSPQKRVTPSRSPSKKSPTKQSSLQSPIKESQPQRSPEKQSPRKHDAEERAADARSPEREIPKESQKESPIKNREALANPVELSLEVDVDETLGYDENVTTGFSAMSVDSGDDASNEVSSDSSLSEVDETIIVDEDTITMDADPQDNTYFFEDMTQTGNIASMIGQISSPKLSKNSDPEMQPVDPQQTESQVSAATNGTQDAADEDDILSTQPADDEKPKRERYFSRFSDDTLMLKDFLSRAQAARAAKAVELGSPTYTNMSPRRSPRKVLGNIGNNFPSPSKSHGPIATGSDTPPGKPSLNMLDAEEDDEIAAGPISQRRSIRSRLPAPSRTAVGAPNFIPLRRADGEPVLLQKTPAQELAISTRANTRRNKGQSKMPKEILEALNAEWHAAGDPAPKKRDGKVSKTVDWDKTLVYYQEPTADKKKKAEKKKEVKIAEANDDSKAESNEEKVSTAVRKVKRLGALNGTPAPKPKRVTVESVSVATPTTRRRGRSAKV